ncbi:hypothetical protein Tco_0892607 [Tanacetum coccineum]|uniref:Uncharacterized protein n=1 Tax=Tanacetum coccineum TaxID=301880 RepID=A0ABQ5C6Q5_9ASTR
MSSMGELTFFLGLQVKQQPDGIFISQDKYVADILKKFDFWSIRTASTHIEPTSNGQKDFLGGDLHVCWLCMCLMSVIQKLHSHLNAVKRIFRYLKHQPKLGLWYPRDSPFELEAFSDSDYGGASLDRKSTTGGCQFLGRRLISWQCKKQTIVANSTTEAEYVAAANCCGQVLWIQNQMMDYGFNFMNTKIHIDNESTISVIKNPVAHSRTKHIEIRFHFIRDCYEKRLIEVIKIHTDSNVADLLTKGFDVTRFNFLVVSIGLYLGSRESLERDMDGTAEFLLSNLFDFWLTKVSTDRLKVSTDRQSLYRYKAVRENTDGWEYRVSSDYGLSRMQFKLLCTHYATIAGKPMTISEASIRSDLLFDDADGIDSLNNQAIFDNIQLRGTSPSIAILDSNPEGSCGNHRGELSNDISLSGNEDGTSQEAKKRSQTTYHTSQILDEECCTKDKIGKKDFSEEKGVQKEYVSKQGRKSVKSSKGEPSVYKDLAFDDLDDDAMDYMKTEDAQDEGRTSSVVLEEKESADKEVSTEASVSTVKPNKGTDKRNKGTDKQDGGTDSTKVSTDRQGEGTADQNEGKSATQTAPTTTSTPTPTIFGDDETIAQVLITMSQNKQKEKEKGVEIRNVEDTKRPRPTSTRFVLTLKPLPKIDPKDKGKKMIDEEGESDTESEDITEAEKKFKQLANDEEVARKVQEEWEAEEEKKRLDEEEATKAALSNEYDFIQARLNADKILTKKLQEEEREMFTIENTDLYERLKREDQNFVAIGSAEDERQIKEMNEESKDPGKKRLKKRAVNKEDTAKVPVEQEVTEQGTKIRKSGHVKIIARKRPRPQPDDDSDDEHRKCLRIITFESTIDSEIMETKSFIARLHKVSSLDGNYLDVYRVNGHFKAFNYLMEVLHIFDRQDLFHLYDLVMKQYSKITLEDIELILWGDLKIMMESSTEENDQVERKYPLSKELLQQMLDLGLEVEEESTAALQLYMHTRSSFNLVGNSSSNPTTSNPKRRNRRRSKQPFSLEESPIVTMADQRTMAELLRAPIEGYAEVIVVPPILAEHFELKHSLINMMTSDQFFRLEKDNPHDHIR